MVFDAESTLWLRWTFLLSNGILHRREPSWNQNSALDLTECQHPAFDLSKDCHGASTCLRVLWPLTTIVLCSQRARFGAFARHLVTHGRSLRLDKKDDQADASTRNNPLLSAETRFRAPGAPPEEACAPRTEEESLFIRAFALLP